MSFTLRPAVREKIGLLFGVAGASGSGKTRSALHLAKGIANGTGKVAVIDTEAGRALHYAPPPGQKADSAKGTFDFIHLNFDAPFTPERYVEAIRACEDAGATVIVVDSFSHEWSGEGGCSDIQMAEAERMAGGDVRRIEAMTAPAWKRPKLRHQRMMARLIQCRTHLIFCLRAQEKIKIIGGKVVPQGFQPICEKSFMFELSGSLMMHPDRPGCPDYELPKKLNDDLQAILPHGWIVGDPEGKRLRLWAETGEDRRPEDKVAEGARDLIERIQDAPDADTLRDLDAEPDVAKKRAYLRKNRPELEGRVVEAFRLAMEAFTPATDDADAEAA